jgi:4,4'-diaponeurosporenoate glycosyltransferase
MLGRLGRFSTWTAVLFPLPLLAFFAVFTHSALTTLVRRRVTWRGRTLEV